MKEQLVSQLEEKARQFVRQAKATDKKILSKLVVLEKRNANIVKASCNGNVKRMEKKAEKQILYYDVHLKYTIKQRNHFYVEEEIERRKASFHKGVLLDDKELLMQLSNIQQSDMKFDLNEGSRVPFTYDRLEAVRYAEQWWNDYNPAYIQFDVDCTNYVSQCLHAGGAPMRGFPKRTDGWWYRDPNNNWSFSWSVANALTVYLTHSKTGLRAVAVEDPTELQLGDVICYDFQGDGRYDHTTIVTAKDAYDMPLVNAHTANSRMRYWSYEDSTAYTPNIRYKMFAIVDDNS